MDTLILWCGFIGAWLLVAGPVYQAALELKDEDIEMERIRAAGAKAGVPPRISAWWWLLPPVKVILAQRRSRRYRHVYLTALASEDVEALLSFMNKATAWLLVASGGFLLAIKETYDLIGHYEWNNFVFAFLVVGMLLLSIGNTIAQISRSEDILQLKKD